MVSSNDAKVLPTKPGSMHMVVGHVDEKPSTTEGTKYEIKVKNDEDIEYLSDDYSGREDTEGGGSELDMEDEGGSAVASEIQLLKVCKGYYRSKECC